MDRNDINYIYERASRRIKFFRKHRGLTQEQLSAYSTFSRGFIANIESKKNTSNIFARGIILPITTSRNTYRIICEGRY